MKITGTKKNYLLVPSVGIKGRGRCNYMGLGTVRETRSARPCTPIPFDKVHFTALSLNCFIQPGYFETFKHKLKRLGSYIFITRCKSIGKQSI